MSSTFLNRILIAVAIVLLVVRLVLRDMLPLDMAPKIIEGNLAMSLVFLAFTCAVLIKKAHFSELIVIPRASMWLALFGAACLASTFYSYDRTVTVQAVIHLLATLLFVLALLDLVRDKPSRTAVISAFLAIALIASIRALIQYKMLVFNEIAPATERAGQYIINTRRPPSFFGWPNILAGYLIMFLPLNWALGLLFRHKGLKALFFMTALINTVVLYLSLTVASWASLFVSGCASAFLLLRREDVIRKHQKWILAAVAVCFIIAGAVLIRRFMVMHVDSVYSRQAYTEFGLKLVKAHPFIGNGWNTYDTITIPMVKTLDQRSAYAHNSYLQVWAETGLAGLVFFMLFIVAALRGLRKMFTALDRKERWVYGCLWAGTLACVIDNTFGFTMIKADIAVYWWLLSGLLLVYQDDLKPGGWVLREKSMAVLIFVITIMFYFTARLMQGEHDYFKGMRLLNSGSSQDAETCFKSSYGFNPWDKKAYYGQALAYCALYNKTHDSKYILLARDATLQAAKQPTLKRETDGLMEQINPAMKQLGLEK